MSGPPEYERSVREGRGVLRRPTRHIVLTVGPDLPIRPGTG